jgi:hypothetical protein
MAINQAQRRAAKAVRRKALVREKRKAEIKGRSEIVDWGKGTLAPVRAPGKASAALLDFAAPLTADIHDRDLLYKCLTVVMFAWNLSMLPAQVRREQMLTFFAGLSAARGSDHQDGPESSAAGFADFEELVTGLISRKLLFFPLDHRWFLDLDVIETPTGLTVNVASTLAATD